MPREDFEVSKQYTQQIWLNAMVYWGALPPMVVKISTKHLSQQQPSDRD